MHYVEAKSILSAGGGMNIYRGCTHGCIYCDSRSLCYQMNHPFEDIEVKRNAPELLARALQSRRDRCMIGTGSMSDPYMHLESQLGLTRQCLEQIERYGFGAAVLTKSDRILRDLELIAAIRENAGAVVQMTLTTAEEGLCRILEPNVCTTSRRGETLQAFRDRGVPTVVWLSPFLPFLNDTEENLRALLRICADTGVTGIVHWGFGLTLRDGSREYFYAQLDRHFPGLKERYIRTYGGAYEIPSPNSSRLEQILQEECAAHGILADNRAVFDFMRRLPGKYDQMSLF